MHRRLIALAALLAAASACADVPVEVHDAWVRATVPGQRSSGAFMQLTAPADATLVGVRSRAAAAVELHEMAMDDKMTMKMRAVASIALPAGKPVALKPGGYHVMLIDLKEQMLPGRKVPLTLVVQGQNGETDLVDVEVPVRPLNAQPPQGHAH
jgi:periplasmic copper chaperone A